MFYGRQVVYPSWISDGLVSSVWQSAAEVYTPFDYLGDTATRIVSRRAIERMLDRARQQASEGNLGKAITLAKGAAHLAYENGYEDLLNEARRFVTKDLEPAYLDGAADNVYPLSVIHDRANNHAWVWLWGETENVHDHRALFGYLEDHRALFESGELHLLYYGVDPDSAVRAIQWVADNFDAKIFFGQGVEELLYSAVT